jgi:hypothetical protein
MPAPLAAFSAPGRFWKGNLHTHSTLSDGKLPPEEVCRIYREGGYDFLSLTDHFLGRYKFPIADTRPFRTNRFTTILGAEVHAPQTRLGEPWHILSVGLPLDFAPRTRSEDGPSLTQRCIDAGAFVAIAHPAWYGLDTEDALSLPANVHAVEVYNHTSQLETDRGDGFYLLDRLLAMGRRLTACATDDAHFKVHDWFGAWVMVKAPTLEPEALLAALKAGAYYSSQGPTIHDVSIGRDAVEISCSPASTVAIVGRASLAAYRIEPGQCRASLPLEKFTGGASPYVRAFVADAFGRRAWTNPIWLD